MANLHIKLPDALYRRFKALCASRGVTMSAYLREVMENEGPIAQAKTSPWGVIHMVGECDSCHRRVRVKLRAAVKGGGTEQWMVQALAICVECGYRVDQSEWMEMPKLGMDLEVMYDDAPPPP